MSKNDKKQSNFSILMETIGKYLRSNYAILITLGVTFILTASLSFVRIATTSSIASFKIDDYEIGQIADITIIASKTLPPDFNNPIGVEKGERITRKGFPITEESYAKMRRMAESPAYIDYRSFADSLLFLLLLVVLAVLLNHEIRIHFAKPELKEFILEAVFFVIIYTVTVFGAKSSIFSSPFSICVIIPNVFFTFIIAILFGQINSLFFSIIISMGVLSATGFQLVPSLYVLATSLSAGLMMKNLERRSDMVFASLLQMVLNVVFLFVFKMIFNATFDNTVLILIGVGANGLLSGILCLGMLTPLELLLNTASPFRLMDLSDMNQPIMQKMLVTASGTYNHSMMVASLAEAACREIGANALLARVGAYYHDIGKIDNPEYFVENQKTGENIHDKLNPSLSVSVIRSHVKRGSEKAKAMHLPQCIIDIIKEHHGNSVIAYFYGEAKEKDPNAIPDDYAYPGTPPSSRESAVVMLADTAEAACRSLKKPTMQALDKFITTLIHNKLESHQLDNCGLTFKELDVIHDSFVQLLAGYYHSRMEYPGQKTNEEENQEEEKNTEEEKK